MVKSKKKKEEGMTLSVNKSLFQGLVHIYTSVIIEYITSHIDKKEN